MVASVSLEPVRLASRRVTTRAGLERLAREWASLWASVPDRTPFQHPAWVLAWWSAFGTGELRLLEVRSELRLIGIAPFYLARSEPGNGELRVVGAGVSDYLDILAAPGAAYAVREAVGRELAESAGEWTSCTFDHLRPGSVLLDVEAPPGIDDSVVDDIPCPALSLPRSPDVLPDTIGRRLAGNIRYGWRRAGRLGSVKVELATPENVQEVLDTLFILHAACWSRRRQDGVLADAAVQAFHRAAAPALLSAGLLRLLALRIGGRTAAVHYGLHAAGRTYFYIGGFDPAFASISPGTLATAAAIEGAIAEGASTFDFLAGREDYKYAWHATDRPRIARRLRRVSGGGAAA